MVFKCPKCSYRTASYKAMQKHFASQHTRKNPKALPKGKQKKVYTYRPPNFKRKKKR